MSILYGLLVTLYVFMCLLLIIIVLVQKGKSSMGLGGLGGGAQLIFGGSGGQDLFQKTTWVLGTLFMAGALGLSIMRSRLGQEFRYLKPIPRSTVQLPVMPQKPAQTDEQN